MFFDTFYGFAYTVPVLLLVLALIVIAVQLVILLAALIRRVRVATRLAEFQLDIALIDAGSTTPPTAPTPPTE